jgi:pre-mRNA-processing factor 19
MSLTCALSGEPLSTTKEEVVATPSGHVCIKRFLLLKLVENGGMDPFEPIRERPLSEDQLVVLQTKTTLPPPRPQATSLPNLLQNIQSEYDSLVLELFDTRKALEETRKELSQALYQNDAAVRVVARLSQERDAARQELERWNASVGGGGGGISNGTATSTPVEKGEEPQTKKRRLENTGLPLKNDLPEEDMTALVNTWQTLQPKRKPMLKEAAAGAPSADDLAAYGEIENKAWHKSTCRGLNFLAGCGDFLVTAGKDKQVVVYHVGEKVVKHSFAGTPTCADVNENFVVTGDAKGKIVAHSLGDGSIMGEIQTDAGAIVDLRIHPSEQHVCAAAADGRVIMASLEGDGLQQVAYFEGTDDSVEYTCGALHPDGLLYAAGTEAGQVLMWDFKNKTLASTLQVRKCIQICMCATAHDTWYCGFSRLSIVTHYRMETLKTLWSQLLFPTMDTTLRRHTNPGRFAFGI